MPDQAIPRIGLQALRLRRVGRSDQRITYRRLSWSVLLESTMRTVRITAMILTIVACGQMFTAVFVGSGGLETLQNFLKDFGVGKLGASAAPMNPQNTARPRSL